MKLWYDFEKKYVKYQISSVSLAIRRSTPF